VKSEKGREQSADGRMGEGETGRGGELATEANSFFFAKIRVIGEN
jgi:hypothetical protein